MKDSHNGLIRLVAVFKLVKAVLLIAVGVGVLRMVHADMADQVEHWVRMLGLNPGGKYVESAIQAVTKLSPQKFKELGIGSFVYAGLFLTEGIGLWLERRWAEWFTVVITSSLVPLEVYEIFKHPTAVKIVVLVINIAVVAYLLYRIKTEPGGAKGR